MSGSLEQAACTGSEASVDGHLRQRPAVAALVSAAQDPGEPRALLRNRFADDRFPRPNDAAAGAPDAKEKLCILAARKLKSIIEPRHAAKDVAPDQHVVRRAELERAAGFALGPVEETSSLDPRRHSNRIAREHRPGNNIRAEAHLGGKQLIKPGLARDFIIIEKGDEIDEACFRQ